MEFRRLGRTDLEVSAISLGTEYLIDQPVEDAKRVIHAALDRGINYVDMFYAQPGFRDVMGACFRGRRHEALITTHLGGCVENDQHAKTRNPEISDRYFHDFLRRLETDYVDFVFLHNCDTQDDYDVLMDPEGLLGLARRYREQGKARFIAFSGHTVATSLQAVQSGAIDVLMFPVNLAGNAVPGKRDLFNACLAHDVGLVAMKPFAGGRLLRADHDFEGETWQVGGGKVSFRRSVPITPVQCLSYVLEQAGLSTIVPGCKSVAELDSAQAYWTASAEERDFSALLADFQQYREGQCVYCNHCLPCPNYVDVGKTMRLLDVARGGGLAQARAAYEAMETNASDCIACGDCEGRCPFGVPVTDLMEEAVALFA